MIMFPAHHNLNTSCGEDGSNSISNESSSKDNIIIKKDEADEEGWLRLSLGSGREESHRSSPDHQISFLPAGTAADETLTQQQQQVSFQGRGIVPLAMTNFTHHQQYDDSYNRPLPRDFRIVNPPRRPHSGVWFILQASNTQTKEPYLPQVQKSYLRIKDGRMTIGLLIKYLVHKLKLDAEIKIEITCKGQQLLPFLSLQHVRDNIWNRPRKDFMFLSSSSTSINHLMVLNYGRI